MITNKLNVCPTPGAVAKLDSAKAKGGGVMGWMASKLGRGRDTPYSRTVPRALWGS